MEEVWLRGPVEGIDPVLMPAAHTILQTREDIAAAAADLTPEELWKTPGGAASAGFHLRHLAGSTERLLTYAHGQKLTEGQRAQLAAEKGPPDADATAGMLIATAQGALDQAMLAIKAADPRTLHDARSIGRAGLPSSIFDILNHIAVHAQRHAGQLTTTVKVVQGTR